MLVKLVVPDNVAITARNTLKKMGYKFDELIRYDYYEYDGGDLSKVDVLVNVNKHLVVDKLGEGVHVLVTNIDTDHGLLRTLRDRLGFKIKNFVKGTVWSFIGCGKEDAIQMTKDLLYNDQYQEFKVL